MKLTLDEDQREIAAVVRRLLAERADSESVRKAMDSEPGFDRHLWNTLAEVGLLGLTVPEELGGAGAGHVYRSLVLSELGRRVVPSPFLGSAVLATDALLEIGDTAANAMLLPGLMDGSRIAALAIHEEALAWPQDGGSAVSARSGDGGWVLDGTKTRVAHATNADLFVVSARTESGPAWFVVDADQATVSEQVTHAPTDRSGEVTFTAASARHLQGTDPGTALARVRDLATVATAALAAGGHEAVVDMTVEYAKTRMQFGRPIGSYQALKHGLADLYCRWELGLSVVRHAASAADEAPEELASLNKNSSLAIMWKSFRRSIRIQAFRGQLLPILVSSWHRPVRACP